MKKKNLLDKFLFQDTPSSKKVVTQNLTPQSRFNQKAQVPRTGSSESYKNSKIISNINKKVLQKKPNSNELRMNSKNQEYFPKPTPIKKKLFQPQGSAAKSTKILPNIISAQTLTSELDIPSRLQQSTCSDRYSDLFQCTDFHFKKNVVFDESRQTPVKVLTKQNHRSPSILRNSKSITLNKNNNSISEKSCSIASNTQFKNKAEQGYENIANKAILQKYHSIISQLQQQSKVSNQNRGNRFSGATYTTGKLLNVVKYKDQLFPAVSSSLFGVVKPKNIKIEEFTWTRISDIFKDKKLTLAQQQTFNLKVIKEQKSHTGDYLPHAFNCLRNCPKMLEIIFQKQKVNPFGIYLVKIYQESTWKYVIIDDFIPTVKTKQGLIKPAFINVTCPKQGPIDIWPFLLQKAYASYYSCYGALKQGNLLDFLQEITGTSCSVIHLDPPKKQVNIEQNIRNRQKLKDEGMSLGTVLIGQLKTDKQYVEIIYDYSSEGFQYELSGINLIAPLKTIQSTFNNIFLLKPLKMNITTTLKKTKVVEKGSFTIHNQEFPSIRTFKVIDQGEYTICLRQKDHKFFHFKQAGADYLWCRMMLYQRQYNNDYRWIGGKYDNKKSIRITCFLQPGEYWVIVEPEWKQNTVKQMILQVFGLELAEFDREKYNVNQCVIEKGCSDLAQRFGQLNQINKNICTYNYVSEDAGLIIQNIVNERLSGNVIVVRSIRELQCETIISPVNKQFYELDSNKNNKIKDQIELIIPKGETYTIVLRLKGGTDLKLLKSFDFGS